jgi:hypothetical protein
MLVNNAGILQKFGRLKSVSGETSDQTIAINVKGSDWGRRE